MTGRILNMCHIAHYEYDMTGRQMNYDMTG